MCYFAVCFAEFEQWKLQEENATMSQYIKIRGDHRHCFKWKKTAATFRSYYCHRSGHSRVRKYRHRHVKVQGSCKIGNKCPAAMFAKISSTGKNIVLVTE